MNPNSVPKLTLFLQDLEATTLRRVKQLGVDHVCMGGPPIPWTDDVLSAHMNTLGAAGLTLSNMMLRGFPNVIYG